MAVSSQNVHSGEVSGGIGEMLPPGDPGLPVVGFKYPRLSILLAAPPHTNVTVSFSSDSGLAENRTQPSGQRGGPAWPTIRLVVAGVRGQDLALRMSPGAVEVSFGPRPSATPNVSGSSPTPTATERHPEERCSGPPQRVSDRSVRLIRRMHQFAGVMLPLTELAVLLVAVALLIIGEIGVDSLLNQLR